MDRAAIGRWMKIRDGEVAGIMMDGTKRGDGWQPGTTGSEFLCILAMGKTGGGDREVAERFSPRSYHRQRRWEEQPRSTSRAETKKNAVQAAGRKRNGEQGRRQTQARPQDEHAALGIWLREYSSGSTVSVSATTSPRPSLYLANSATATCRAFHLEVGVCRQERQSRAAYTRKTGHDRHCFQGI